MFFPILSSKRIRSIQHSQRAPTVGAFRRNSMVVSIEQWGTHVNIKWTVGVAECAQGVITIGGLKPSDTLSILPNTLKT